MGQNLLGKSWAPSRSAGGGLCMHWLVAWRKKWRKKPKSTNSRIHVSEAFLFPFFFPSFSQLQETVRTPAHPWDPGGQGCTWGLVHQAFFLIHIFPQQNSFLHAHGDTHGLFNSIVRLQWAANYVVLVPFEKELYFIRIPWKEHHI